MEDKNMSHMKSDRDVLDISSSDVTSGEFSKYLYPKSDSDIGQSILNRSSRVLEALFLVSNAIPVNERIRVEIRDRAMSLFSRTIVAVRQPSVESLAFVLDDVVTVLALTQAASTSGYLSAQTLEVVHGGVKNFYTRISRCVDTPTAGNILKDITMGHENVSYAQQRTEIIQRQNVDESLKNIGHSNNGQIASKGLPPLIRLDKKNSSRTEAILDLVRSKHRVTVKDIHSVVKGFSQKTLQRELLALVTANVLKKEGERRWSVYSLRTNGAPVSNGTHGK